MEEPNRVKIALDWLLDGQRLTQEEIAELTGIDRPNVSRLKKGVGKPRPSTLHKLERGLSAYINPDWLLHGSGDMVAASRRRDEGLYPFYPDVEIAAGSADPDPKQRPEDVVYKGVMDFLPGCRIFAPIHGDSMEPTLRSDDLVALGEPITASELREGDIYVVTLRQHGSLIKRVYVDGATVNLVSDNPSYPPQQFPTSDIITMMPVVGSLTPHKNLKL